MFIDATPPQRPLSEEINPPALSQSYYGTLSQHSFDARFREELQGAREEAENIRRLLAECAAVAFERSLEIELRSLCRHLTSGETHLYFSSPRRSLRELIPILGVVPSEAREQFVVDIADALHSRVPLEHVSSKLDNICQYLLPDERARVANEWLARSFTGRGSCIDALLRSAATAEELAALVVSCGETRLLSAGGREIAEILACAELAPILRQPISSIQLEDHLGAYKTLMEEIERRIEACSASLYKGTDFCGTALRALKGTLERVRLESTVTLENASLERVSALVTIARLEGKYCIAITESGGATWTTETLRDLEAVLQRLPESVILHTPLLYEVRMNGALPAQYYGLRHGNGTVEVGPHTAVSVELTIAYDGNRPLQVVLAHEIGHGIQLGKYAYEKGALTDTRGFGNCGDPRYDFGDYIELSGWRLVSATALEISAGGTGVKVDGVEYALGTEVEFRGEKVVLTVNQGRLYAFKAQAKFSHDPYSRSDPWEDWAEAFSEYLFLPTRLAKDAPGKFLFFDQEFNRYGANSRNVKDAMRVVSMDGGARQRASSELGSR